MTLLFKTKSMFKKFSPAFEQFNQEKDNEQKD